MSMHTAQVVPVPAAAPHMPRDTFAAALEEWPRERRDALMAQATPDKVRDALEREQLRPVIEREALAWAVAMVSPQEIDRINILRASITAMHRALDQLQVRPEGILVDGNRFYPYQDIPYTTIVKGDGKMLSIAAASILAKTHRDEFMRQLDQEFPQYGWAKNKGYPTPDHRAAIAQYGATPHHRYSFQLLPQPTLFDGMDF